MAGLDSPDRMQAFVDEFGLPFPQTVSEDGTLWARFGILGQGEWVFVDPSGTSTLVPEDLGAEDLRMQLDLLLAS